MMGRELPPQPSLFHRGFSLDTRVHADHPLRAVAALIDFDFINDEVEHLYGAVGNESVPPSRMLKLMFLLFWESVRSERQMMACLPARLDWLWFLGLEIDSAIPDHSVLSKARTRWGAERFREFFLRVLRTCMDAGLVDGSKMFCDGSLVDANAARKTHERVGTVDLGSIADEFEKKLDMNAPAQAEDQSAEPTPVVESVRSTTDPDAVVVSKRGAGPARARYKTHRAIDDQQGIITATLLTPGDVDEGHQLLGLVDQHERNTECRLSTVVGDTQYGTITNYLACHDRGVNPHFAAVRTVNQKKTPFIEASAFTYEPATDTYRCPAAQTLHRIQNRTDRDAARYGASVQVCDACPLKSDCTSGSRRTITRQRREEEIQMLIHRSRQAPAQADLRRRHHFMEGSFATGWRFGLKRCRWRRLWRAQIQDLLIAAVQNIQILITKRTRRSIAAAAAAAALVANLRSLLKRSFLAIQGLHPRSAHFVC